MSILPVTRTAREARQAHPGCFSRVSDPYEAPTALEVHVRTHEESLETCVARIAATLQAVGGSLT
jgi:adenylylsulfate kinase-like enzyme